MRQEQIPNQCVSESLCAAWGEKHVKHTVSEWMKIRWKEEGGGEKGSFSCEGIHLDCSPG